MRFHLENGSRKILNLRLSSGRLSSVSGSERRADGTMKGEMLKSQQIKSEPCSAS